MERPNGTKKRHNKSNHSAEDKAGEIEEFRMKGRIIAEIRVNDLSTWIEGERAG